MTHRRLWLVALCSALVLPVDMPGVALQLLLFLLLNVHHTSCYLLLGSQLNPIMLQIVLLEGCGVHQDNGILHQSLCSDLQKSRRASTLLSMPFIVSAKLHTTTNLALYFVN